MAHQYPFDNFLQRRKEGDYIRGKHEATDYGLPKGTPIYASFDGTIEWGDESRQGVGLVANGEVDILPPFVLAPTIAVRFKKMQHFHMQRIAKPGQKVKKGELICRVSDAGSPGSFHDHLQIEHIDKSLLDPEWVFGCWLLWDNVDDLNTKLSQTSGAVQDQLREQLRKAQSELNVVAKNLSEMTLKADVLSKNMKDAEMIYKKEIEVYKSDLEGRNKKINELNAEITKLKDGSAKLFQDATTGEYLAAFFASILKRN